MENMKKILSFLLAAVMLFGVASLSVSAVNEENVARMWLCSEINDNTGIGHVFLYFENLTGETITVGKCSVAAYGDVSVGNFGTEGPDGAGVYYNLETELDHYSQLMGLSTELTADELEAVSGKISGYDWWGVLFNCNYFALLAWNAGSDSDVPFLIFPQITRFFIRLKGGIANPFDLFSRDVEVYKQSEM